jgi:membrane dipeptidase
MGNEERRAFLKGCAAVAAAAVVPAAARGATGYSDADYRRAIVIDGQGSIADPFAPPDQARLSARAISELRASGQTACSLTVAEVGNGLDVFNATVRINEAIDQIIADNNDLFLKVGRAADILRAKTEGKVGAIYNSQDTYMV